jgi:hypothetical protein
MSKGHYRRHKVKVVGTKAVAGSRQQIAFQAAKLLLSGNAQDYDSAKRKAAKQLGIKLEGPLPSDSEVEENLTSYQNLFRKDEHKHLLSLLRRLAEKAMTLLHAFSPRLVGPVLHGIVTQNTPVNLLIFSDPVENVDIFLMEKRIPFEMGLEMMTLSDGSTQQIATYRIKDNNVAVEIIALPVEMRKHLPVQGKNNSLIYRGAGIEELKRLMSI